MNVGFSTLSHPELEEYRSKFYIDRRKVIPRELELMPLSMAVWFMDDGSRKSSQCRGPYLNTQSFNSAEVAFLQDVIRRDVGVETTVRQQRDGLQIYVPASSTPELTDFITREMLPSMRYKLPG